jgi:ribosomal protein S18 acetylase RimI-like enzyme
MHVHPAAEADYDRILPFVLKDPLGWVDAGKYRQYLSSGSYHANRIWLAEEHGRIVACAVWYDSSPDDHSPIVDCLWVDPAVTDRAALGAAVLQAGRAWLQSAGRRDLEHHLFLAPGWRHDAAACAEVEWRRAAVRAAGLSNERERLRYEWTSEAGVEPSSGRLVFSAESSDEVFLDAFRRVAVGSLDGETGEDMARLGAEGQAQKALQLYQAMRGSRGWWRMAHTPDGHVAGFTIPSANEDFPVIGYLGVVPEMRGRGYARDLLAEATRILAEHGADRIRSDTDLTNAPMAAAFERTRYRNFSVRLIFRT